MNTRKIFCLVLALTLIFSAPVLAGTKVWEKKVDSDVRFKVTHDTGIIIVGTKQTVYGFDPETGSAGYQRFNRLRKKIRMYARQCYEDDSSHTPQTH